MPDLRELILARVLVILQGVMTANPALVNTVVRNRALLRNEKRPALVLLDGDEQSKLDRNDRSGRAVGFAPSIMTMRPQIFILAEEQRPTNAELGPDLNLLRKNVIEALAADTTLKTHYTANGSINYNSTVTDMKSGGAVTGMMMLDFSINYPLIPD